MAEAEGSITISYDDEGQPYYKTSDSYTTGFLNLRVPDNRHELVSENGARWDFCFPVSDQLLKALRDYYSGQAVVNALAFSQAVKAARGEILRRKENQNGKKGYTRVNR
jgi:hypothetical protein